MASSNRREREIARARAERQEARRAQARQKQRRQVLLAAVASVLAVLVGVGVIAFLNARPDTAQEAEPQAAPSQPAPTEAAPSQPPPSPAAAPGECSYQPAEQASRPVQPPPTGAEVRRTGTATLTLTTGAGDIGATLDAAAAPCTTNALASLAQQKFYDGTPCHRLTASPSLSVLQCGDPTGTGSGGPGYQYAEENLGGGYPAGTLAMAKTQQPGTTGSQFFLVYGDSQLPPQYTVVGRVTTGLDVLQGIGRAGVQGGGEDGPPATPVQIETATVTYSG